MEEETIFILVGVGTFLFIVFAIFYFGRVKIRQGNVVAPIGFETNFSNMSIDDGIQKPPLRYERSFSDMLDANASPSPPKRNRRGSFKALSFNNFSNMSIDDDDIQKSNSIIEGFSSSDEGW